jgi:hypothetical protein
MRLPFHVPFHATHFTLVSRLCDMGGGKVHTFSRRVLMAPSFCRRSGQRRSTDPLPFCLDGG